MATDVLSSEVDEFGAPQRPQSQSELGSAIREVLRPLASLKLTVALFALAIFLVLTGTLAQARHDIGWVLNNYFRTPLAWIELNVFFPPAWFYDYPNLLNLKGSFPFPGGFAIGTAMAVNLLAAHGLRFKVQTKGLRLWAGLGVIAAGCLLTWLVIAAGPDKDGSQATAPVDWLTLWRLFLVGIACVCGGIAAALFSLDPARRVERIVLGCVGTALLCLLAFLLFGVNSQAIDPSAMRILWQLMKAEFAALVLLAGCVLAFRKRAGIVLLHAGVGLIMANELVVHFLHKEEQMMIIQGTSANYAYDIRATELAVIDGSNPKSDNVIAIPETLLQKSANSQTPIADDKLPFDIRITKYFGNSDIVDGKPPEENLANAGIGRLQYAADARAVTGADGGDRVSLPAAYAEFLDKKSGTSLGKYLLGILVGPQHVKLADKTYEVALRFERDYKPYTIHLNEVRGDMYMGTTIPRNYSSEIRLEDADRDVDRRAYIRMNEPLRYGGETFYQSGFDDGRRTGAKSTTLQVVANFGWMIPYVACMVIITGMLAQFVLTLRRFLGRLEPKTSAGGNVFVIAGALCLFALVLVSSSLPPSRQISTFDFYAAGKIPIVYGGRVQPLDTLARSTLRIISSREVFVDNDGNTQPAMRWLFDVIARPKVAAEHQVIRIDSPEVRDMLQLPRHISHSLFGGSVQRYSPNELAPHAADLHAEVERLSKKNEGESKQYTTVEKKTMELSERGQIYQAVADAFHLSPELNTQAGEPAPLAYLALIQKQIDNAGMHGQLPPFPTKEEMQQDPENTLKIVQLWVGLDNKFSYDQFLRSSRPPLVIPSRESRSSAPVTTDEHNPTQWSPYSAAWLEGIGDLLASSQPNPAVAQWQEIIDAYAAQDAGKFNAAVANYRTSLENDPPRQLIKASPGFEAWFNHAELFFIAMIFYLLAFVLVGFSWLTGWTTLNRAAFWLIVAVFVVHTFALIARMTISGRPPVTNLYSTAIFIGWAGVLLGLILELVFYRLGFGAAIAAIAGCATLLIADKLSLLVDSESRGDTIGVMRAVLDTQFWLATHVTTVNLGYATTYIAGLLGLVYVVAGVFTPALTKDLSKLLGRMIYGAVCFAMVFSFLGPVLGGLWADDSWGRFWGWDPKENGALIIVIWNALILHARWDGLVKDRGLALLAIAGNIFTSWSYFGVNQLGIGLHSYGFTEGVLVALGVFCVSQLLMIGAGLVPQRFWISRNALI
jgi:ABC-type transport system involved in cytochrome c biogenesis permease subunit